MGRPRCGFVTIQCSRPQQATTSGIRYCQIINLCVSPLTGCMGGELGLMRKILALSAKSKTSATSTGSRCNNAASNQNPEATWRVWKCLKTRPRCTTEEKTASRNSNFSKKGENGEGSQTKGEGRSGKPTSGGRQGWAGRGPRCQRRRRGGRVARRPGSGPGTSAGAVGVAPPPPEAVAPTPHPVGDG